MKNGLQDFWFVLPAINLAGASFANRISLRSEITKLTTAFIWAVNKACSLKKINRQVITNTGLPLKVGQMRKVHLLPKQEATLVILIY
ncbi:hypothetical protein [Flavihumibacter fluvii]|uniref:hypothetical protein n=1 Tax=Flavihumibacter fluvii TaxID=2838157 RepID=UPI001BDEF7D7|nr:hypothetical protein [Flavihumibacter fluvii]ULQ50711.1 hypothetical protein KJS93_11525 [Flavihumibacter fluvii]